MNTHTQTAQHTIGPWRDTNTNRIVGGDGALVADCNIAPRRDRYESDANARLIAAAPELLAALEAINPMDITAAARELRAAAIDKATVN